MTGKKILFSIAAAVLLLAAAFLLWLDYLPLPWGDGAAGDLNVLLITLDTTRADSVGCYGHPTVKTPFIDSLAEKGVLFEQCTTSAPITLPTHASLMTGLEPFVHGARTNGNVVADQGNETLAEILARAEYRTAAVTASFVLHSSFGIGQGFQFVDDVENTAEKDDASPAPGRQDGKNQFAEAWAQLCQYSERKADDVADRAVSWLKQHSEEKFFLWVHFYDPHIPYTPPQRFKNRFADPYLGEIAFMDEQIGRILSVLEELEISDNTVIVVAGDHGEGLGDHGEETHTCFLYDSTLSVPLVFSSPGGLPERKRIDAQVRIVDVAPTILDILGLDPMPVAHGVSLLPLIRGERTEGFTAYSETMIPRYDFKFSHLRSVRRGGWKYIHAPTPELYHVETDPDENSNMASERPDLVKKMRRLLHTLIETSPPRIVQEEKKAVSREDREKLMAMGYMGGQGEDSGKNELDLLEPEGDDPKAHAREIRLVSHGQAAMAQSRLKKAQDYFEQASVLHPTWTIPREFLAITLSQQGRGREAIDCLKKVVEEEPDNAGTQFRLGMICADEKETEMARRHLAEAARLSPQNIEARRWLARDALTRGFHAEAVKRLRESLGLDPENVEILALLSWILATCPDEETRNGDEAAVLGNKACRLSKGQNALALHSLGAAFAENGIFSRAVEKSTQAAQRAEAKGNTVLAREIERIRDQFYKKDKPYRELKMGGEENR